MFDLFGSVANEKLDTLLRRQASQSKLLNTVALEIKELINALSSVSQLESLRQRLSVATEALSKEVNDNK